MPIEGDYCMPVDRILKAYDLITSPAFTVVSAKDRFEHPTTRTNELWQTDFTYLKVVQWGWYYLSTVMDDFSHYIIAWQLCRTRKAEDVKNTLDMAIANPGSSMSRWSNSRGFSATTGPVSSLMS
jgi:transposase InsO family protein